MECIGDVFLSINDTKIVRTPESDAGKIFLVGMTSFYVVLSFGGFLIGGSL